MKIKNKFLFIFLVILILFSFTLINCCFAAESTSYTITGRNGNTVTFPEFTEDNIENGFFIQYWSGTYYMGVFNSSDVHLYKSGYKIGSNVSYKEYSFNTSSNSWAFYRNMNANGEICGESGLFYSSVDIYSSSSSNDVAISKTGTNFFLPEPEVTLATILEENSPTETFQTMIHGIIPYLIAFLVGLVAFWKGWKFLSKELHKA